MQCFYKPIKPRRKRNHPAAQEQQAPQLKLKAHRAVARQHFAPPIQAQGAPRRRASVHRVATQAQGAPRRRASVHPTANPSARRTAPSRVGTSHRQSQRKAHRAVARRYIASSTKRKVHRAVARQHFASPTERKAHRAVARRYIPPPIPAQGAPRRRASVHRVANRAQGAFSAVARRYIAPQIKRKTRSAPSRVGTSHRNSSARRSAPSRASVSRRQSKRKARSTPPRASTPRSQIRAQGAFRAATQASSASTPANGKSRGKAQPQTSFRLNRPSPSPGQRLPVVLPCFLRRFPGEPSGTDICVARPIAPAIA